MKIILGTLCLVLVVFVAESSFASGFRNNSYQTYSYQTQQDQYGNPIHTDGVNDNNFTHTVRDAWGRIVYQGYDPSAGNPNSWALPGSGATSRQIHPPVQRQLVCDQWGRCYYQ